MSELIAAQFETDFDVEEEFAPVPVIPQGNYRGSVTGVIFDGDKQSINFDVTLDGNDVLMSDGETEVDGSKVTFRVWLPKQGDENEMTSGGRQTKKQWKINNLKKVSESMGIDMNTPKAIADGINNGDWIGLDVIANIRISTWNDELKNDVNSLIAAP